MCKILSRIKTLADTEGLSIGSIERAIGASRGVISKAIAKGTDIQSKWLELICERFPQYSPVWLLTGEGSMHRDVIPCAPMNTMNISEPHSEKVFTSTTQKLSNNTAETPLVTQLIKELKELAIENGSLKERIAQLEREKNASVESLQHAPKALSASPMR